MTLGPPMRPLAAMQADLLRAARLGAVGAMAGGLAHELNQPLAAAANFIAAARRMLGPATDAAIAASLADAAGELHRAAEIVRRLAVFVDRGEAELLHENVADLVRQACATDQMRALAGAARLELRIAGPHRDVLADRVALGQVLANLIRNAGEAVGGDPLGCITVSVTPEGEGASVIVADNGPGVPPEIVARLFQPFATTKLAGMGIGLAISRTIVEGHGGSLALDGGHAPGAAFRIWLPHAGSWDRACGQ